MMRKEEKKAEEKKAKEKKLPDHEKIVLRADCEGCAKRVQGCLRGFDGVEDVEIDIKSRIVTIMGKKVDPLKIMERARSETRKHVELLSWIPKPPITKKDKKEEPKPEKKEGPHDQMIKVVVLKLDMHCEGCAQKIKESILRMEGVERAEPDFKSSKVTVKGVFEPPKLVEYVYKQTKRHAVIEKQEAYYKEGDKQKKEDKKDGRVAVKAEKMEERRDQMIRVVVLELDMHCEGCAQKIKKSILRMEGVERAEPDFKSSKVTVKGVFDPPKLVEYVYKQTERHAVIVKQEAYKKEGGEEKKEGKKDGREAVKAEKKEERRDQMITMVVLELELHCEGCAQKIKKSILRMEGVEQAEPDFKSSKVIVKGAFDPPKLVEYVYRQTKRHAVIVKHEAYKKEGGEEKKEDKKDDRKAAKTEGREETKAVGMKRDEYHYFPAPMYANANYAYATEHIFSDENPNACSVM